MRSPSGTSTMQIIQVLSQPRKRMQQPQIMTRVRMSQLIPTILLLDSLDHQQETMRKTRKRPQTSTRLLMAKKSLQIPMTLLLGFCLQALLSQAWVVRLSAKTNRSPRVIRILQAGVRSQISQRRMILICRSLSRCLARSCLPGRTSIPTTPTRPFQNLFQKAKERRVVLSMGNGIPKRGIAVRQGTRQPTSPPAMLQMAQRRRQCIRLRRTSFSTCTTRTTTASSAGSSSRS
mmetsp:Transcript_61395/g.146310  ORF Transcript_61395/g.146310 Transcript_61395/m.146310 type:complete len:233 (+) Transcript_61395:96-794(+)